MSIFLILFLNIFLLLATISKHKTNGDSIHYESTTTQASYHLKKRQHKENIYEQNNNTYIKYFDSHRNLKEYSKPRQSNDPKYCFPADDFDPSHRTHLAVPDGESDLPVSNIAFSSCMRPGRRASKVLWRHLRKTFKPDLWVWLGDNAYADGHDEDQQSNGNDMRFRRYKYNQVRDDVYYRTFGPIGEPKIPVTGIWDDHDFGGNDMGIEYPCKKKSQKEFAIHFNIPESDPRHHNHPKPNKKRDGIYSSHLFPLPKSYRKNQNKKHHGIHLINLDTRYFRHRLHADGNREKCYRFRGGGKHTDILGSDQWTWLEKQLLSSSSPTSEITIITTSIQILPSQNFEMGSGRQYCAYDGSNRSFDKSIRDLDEKPDSNLFKSPWCREMWSDVPVARRRLLRMVQRAMNKEKTKVVIFLSGDIHMGELMAKRIPARSDGQDSQVVYEVTASGIGKTRQTTLVNHERVRLRTCDDQGDEFFVKECKFPFEWNGRVYHDCTTDGNRYDKGGRKQPWCEHDRNSGGWGYCIKERDELVPMKDQMVRRVSSCSDNYHHTCNYKGIYGGIKVDWAKGKINLSLYTPREMKKDGLSSQITISFDPKWKS